MATPEETAALRSEIYKHKGNIQIRLVGAEQAVQVASDDLDDTRDVWIVSCEDGRILIPASQISLIQLS